jgi:hypothetical protein
MAHRLYFKQLISWRSKNPLNSIHPKNLREKVSYIFLSTNISSTKCPEVSTKCDGRKTDRNHKKTFFSFCPTSLSCSEHEISHMCANVIDTDDLSSPLPSVPDQRFLYSNTAIGKKEKKRDRDIYICTRGRQREGDMRERKRVKKEKRGEKKRKTCERGKQKDR